MSNNGPMQFEALAPMSAAGIRAFLDGDPPLDIHLSCWHKGSQDPNAYADEILFALYIGKSILPFCANLEVSGYTTSEIPQNHIRFTLRPADFIRLSDKLFELSSLAGDDEARLSVVETLEEFRDKARRLGPISPQTTRIRLIDTVVT